jgi:hypothetical protein
MLFPFLLDKVVSDMRGASHSFEWVHVIGFYDRQQCQRFNGLQG